MGLRFPSMENIILRAHGLELKFQYDEATNRAYDENNVRYEVQVDQ
ncbi:hypothetical protein HSIEG1_416 [Enterococcus sp. HSIEG1]|nr:hypothetical protein HSIEG1_416 [Enterococcus sp. HSIEG1]